MKMRPPTGFSPRTVTADMWQQSPGWRGRLSDFGKPKLTNGTYRASFDRLGPYSLGDNEARSTKMRAEINARGCLTITPETALETYALKQWWDGYNPGEECESMLVPEGIGLDGPPRPSGPPIHNPVG